MNMPVDPALAAKCGIGNGGKHSTSPLLWRWEKVKRSELGLVGLVSVYCVWLLE